ncbi:MAG: ATP-binding cassette domain-containing protein [Heliomarina sp.]|uniref:ATP-binding cassette domain-containing protein n=1 Tax=Heliomarina sp. TaxID=2917556 RepID=UPI004057FBF7
MTLRAENLSLGCHDHIAINDLAIELKRGDMTTILSPNGCGNSAVLKSLARLVNPLNGRVTLNGRDIHA